MHLDSTWARRPLFVATLLLTTTACAGGSKSSSDTSVPDSRPGPTTSTSAAPLTLPSTSSTPASVPRRRSVTIPSSIAHDCSVDVASAIQTWIASVPDNSILSLRAQGCYRIDETVTIENRHHLLLNGNGATLRAFTIGDRTRQELALTGGSDLTVRNLVVRGANPHAGANRGAYRISLEAQHAFAVNGATNVLLDHVQGYDTYGDFVYVGPDDAGPSRNVTVSNSTFARSGRQGISITDGIGITITHNVIGEVPQTLFDVEPNHATQNARSIRIVDNITGAAGNFWFANKGARADTGDIEISGNRMAAPTGGLVFVYASGGAPRGPYVITDNRLLASTKTHDEHSVGAFFFTNTHDVTITGNVVTFPKGVAMPAVEFRASRLLRVRGNTFTNGGQTVLATQGSSDLQVG